MSDRVMFWGRWVLKLLVAAAFIGAGGAKLAGAAPMVQLFDDIGIGQWFRVVTGVIEVGGAALVLIPRTATYGAAVLAVTMVGAVITHLFIIGGSPVPALVLLVLSALIGWSARNRVSSARPA